MNWHPAAEIRESRAAERDSAVDAALAGLPHRVMEALRKLESNTAEGMRGERTQRQRDRGKIETRDICTQEVVAGSSGLPSFMDDGVKLAEMREIAGLLGSQVKQLASRIRLGEEEKLSKDVAITELRAQVILPDQAEAESVCLCVCVSVYPYRGARLMAWCVSGGRASVSSGDGGWEGTQRRVGPRRGVGRSLGRVSWHRC